MVVNNMNDYESWKMGKKVFKAPWVIEYWKSITDENQYKLSKKVENRLVIILGTMLLIGGFLLGYAFPFKG